MPAAIRIYRSLEELGNGVGPCAVTIGNFDGVHAGHRRIFRRVAQIAAEHRWKATVLTFDPHPTKVVAPERLPRLLSTPLERSVWMGEEGIEQVVVLPFSREFSQLSPADFVAQVLIRRLEARAVLIGENFRFGRGHAGDATLLCELGRKLGFLTEVVSGVSLRRRLVSSSEVRRLVEAGRVALASRLLERAYALEGEVVPGRGIGSKHTVPTLNLATSAEVLPAAGVYVTRTTVPATGRTFDSVTNIGCRPTFGGETLSIETFLLDPPEGDPPRRIRVAFLRRLREERRWEAAEQLREQIWKDVARARAYFRRWARWVHPSSREAELAH